MLVSCSCTLADYRLGPTHQHQSPAIRSRVVSNWPVHSMKSLHDLCSSSMWRQQPFPCLVSLLWNLPCGTIWRTGCQQWFDIQRPWTVDVVADAWRQNDTSDVICDGRQAADVASWRSRQSTVVDDSRIRQTRPRANSRGLSTRMILYSLCILYLYLVVIYNSFDQTNHLRGR